jgi:hypothetical protein
MEKKLESLKNKRCFPYIIITVIGILVSLPLIGLQIRGTDDGWLHLIRIIGIDNAIKNESFPFLIQPFFCNDWGYSMTAFYPSIVSYVPYFLSIFMGSFINGIKIFAAITVILSGITMYQFLMEITEKKKLALIGAIVYMILPYRLENIYNRFAIGEFTAFVFIPLVFLGLYNLLNGNGKKHYYIAIGATGLMLSHTISTIYTAVFCLIYILFNLKLFFKKDVLIKCLINVIFILLISAIFWVPMLEFKQSAEYAIFEPDALKTSGKYVANNTIELWQLLKDKNEENGVSFVIGIPFITMLLLGIFVFKKLDQKLKDLYITNIVLAVISIIMCTKFFPWIIMPDFLCTLQYPWRLLGFALFFLTPICAINVYFLIKEIKNKKTQDGIYMIVILILFIFTLKELSSYQIGYQTIDSSYEEQIVQNPKIHYFSVNRDYMPLKALKEQRGYLYTRTDETYVINGEAIISNEEKYGLKMKISLEKAKEGTKLELPYLFYPGYTVKLVEKSSAETIINTSESENGFLQIMIPHDIENAEIIVNYTGTTIEKTAYIGSGISVILFICYIIYFRKKDKEEINERKD